MQAESIGSDVSTGFDSSRFTSDLDHLRTEALRALLPGIALGVYLLAAILLGISMTRVSILTPLGGALGGWLLGAAFWGTCLISYLGLAHGARLASVSLVLGLVLSLALSLYWFPHSTFACGFSLVVVIAGLLLGPQAGLLVALASSGILTVDSIGPKAVTGEIFLTSLTLIWASAFLSWLSSRPLFDALSWSWNAYEQAWHKTEEARQQRAELVKLSKNLNEAYYRLEVLNSKLRQAREAAEEARRLKAQFAANISHELRTPLNLIIGFSEMMVLAPRTYHGERLPERYRGDVEAIYRNARHLSDLIDDVLELSQIDANRVGLKMEWASLSDIVQEAVMAVAGLFKDKQLALVTDVPGDLPMLYADRTRIRQVLINLLNNAARFTDEGGVRVAAETDGSEVAVSVTDTGIGIPEADVPKVFREFYQIGIGGERSRGGSGLGLAITKRFVELHGGRIWVESRAGVGTTFRFTLPIAGHPSSMMAIPRPASALPLERAGDERPVVVFGEDPEPLRILQRHLDGYRVEVALTAEEAYEKAERSAAYAAIAVCSEASARWLQLRANGGQIPDLPLLSCEWHTSRETRESLGVLEYIVKPVSRERVRLVLHRLGNHVRNLLIVDDDAEMQRLLGQMIAFISPSYHTSFASDGASALALMREGSFDAVFLDLMMPGVNGYFVLQEMRANDRLRSLPVVVITARGVEEEAIVLRRLNISRSGGFSAGEAVRCISATLDALLETPRSSAQERPVDPTASPV